MLLWALLLHLAIHLLSAARDAPSPENTAVRPIDSRYVVRPVKTCPEEGYYFQKEKLGDQSFCFLCFCKTEHTAICWKRDNRRCDSSTFVQNEVERPKSRIRRSADPFGLSDFLFRDVARGLFNKETKQECKPHESSFSEGCPPKDWCIGCTVCDCDVTGHWDCHILSFCPEKKSTSKGKKPIYKVTPKPKTLTNNTKRTNTVPKKTVPKKANTKPKNNRGAQSKTKPQLPVVKKTIPKAGKKKPLVTSQAKRPSKKKVTQRPAQTKFINKQISHRPMKIKKNHGSKLVLNENNSTVKLAQQILASVMMATKKVVGNQMKNVSKNIFMTTKPMKPGTVQVQKNNSSRKLLVKKYRIRNKRDVTAAYSVVDNNSSIRTEEPSSSHKLNSMDHATITLDKNVYTTLELTNQSKYYKYIIETNQTTTEISANKINNNINNTETIPNLGTTTKIDSLSEPVKMKRNSSEPTVRTLVTVDDINSNKIDTLKILEDNVLNSMMIRTPREKFIKKISYEKASTQPLMHSKDVSQAPHLKKYKPFQEVSNYKKSPELQKGRSKMQQIIRDKIVAMHKTVNTLFNHIYRVNQKSMRNTKKKYKKMTLIKYLKKFLNKVFVSKQHNTESEAMKSLCEAFGRCQLNDTEKRIIRSKLKSLNKDASNILKSIRIIKGLLHLIPIPLKNTTNNNTKSSLGNDLQKLDVILKGTYNFDQNYKLSETDLTQIKYVKKNTQDFILSMSKLATKLDEIIAIIKSGNKKKRNVTNMTGINQIKATIKNPFGRIKSLLLSYNLAHNNFMEKLNNALKDVEYSFKNKKVPKVSDDDKKNFNYTAAVENFSRNIINNVRRLKGLAQNMIFNNRIKRNIRSMTRENESMEYLLMLMEYLIKQSQPQASTSGNDGIDLLIEAIKSAPDIKPMKENILQRTFVPMSEKNKAPTISPNNITHTLAHSNDVNKIMINNFDDYDNQLDGNSSNDDSVKNIFGNNKEADQSLTNYKQIEENNQLNKNVNSATEPEEFRPVNDFGKVELVDSFLNTTEPLQVLNEFKQSGILEYDNSDKFDLNKESMDADAKGNENRVKLSESNEDENVPKVEPDLKATDDKIVTTGKKDKDKLIEQDLDSSFYNDLIPEAKSTAASKHTTPHFLETETVRKYYDSDRTKTESDNLNKLTESKSPIDWVEENFGIETKTSRRSHETLQRTTVLSTTEVAVKKTETTKAASHVTRFMDSGKTKTIDVEDVIYKKQMALLNSLDYGTERIAPEDTDSKDERSASDSYQAYN